MERTLVRARLLVLAAVVVVLPVVVTACSSSISSSATTRPSNPYTDPTTPSASSQHLCSLVSAADIKSALGASVRPAFATTHGSITTCTYLSADRTASVSIRYTTGAMPATFAAARALFVTDGETVTPISGLGNEAIGATAPSGLATVSSILVRKGSTTVSVTAKAPIAQVHAVAEQIAPKL
jgi:hypothetical protein